MALASQGDFTAQDVKPLIERMLASDNRSPEP